MRILRFKKDTGCVIEAIVFGNGYTVACWQTGIPEVAVYQNIEQFLNVRTEERGYRKIFDSEIETMVTV